MFCRARGADHAWLWDAGIGPTASPNRRARFFAERKAMPSMLQAGVYSAVLHYLKAMQAAGTDESKAVAAKMREIPIDDFWSKGVKIREDGRVMRDMHLFQVKKPDESKGPWDYYKLISTTPGAEAFRPLSESECPLIKK